MIYLDYSKDQASEWYCSTVVLLWGGCLFVWYVYLYCSVCQNLVISSIGNWEQNRYMLDLSPRVNAASTEPIQKWISSPNWRYTDEDPTELMYVSLLILFSRLYVTFEWVRQCEWKKEEKHMFKATGESVNMIVGKKTEVSLGLWKMKKIDQQMKVSGCQGL